MIACGVKGEEAIVGHAEGSVGIKVRHAGLAEVVERLNQCVIVRGFLGSVRETLRLDCQVFSSVVGVVVGSINDHRIPRERFVWPLAPEIIAVATRRACARAHNPLRRVVALEASAAAAAVKLLRRHSAPSAEQRLAAHKGLLPQSVTTVYLQQHACPPSAHHPFRNERDASQREDLPATTIKHLSSLQQQTRPARIPLCRSRRAELGQRRNSPRWGSLSTVLALLALPLRAEGKKRKSKFAPVLPPAFPSDGNFENDTFEHRQVKSVTSDRMLYDVSIDGFVQGYFGRSNMQGVRLHKTVLELRANASATVV